MTVNGEINVVSLIDVMMLLMVIFMITAPIMQGGVDIALPQASVKPLEAKTGLIVTIDRRGVISVDRTTFTFPEFQAAVRQLASRKGGDGAYVRADENANYGDVLRVIAAMREGGIADVGLVAEPVGK